MQFYFKFILFWVSVTILRQFLFRFNNLMVLETNIQQFFLTQVSTIHVSDLIAGAEAKPAL